MARYEAGETLASIARTYDCSPPAISYVVARSRTRPAVAAPPGATAGPSGAQLIKATASRPPVADPSPVSMLPANGQSAERNGGIGRVDGNGFDHDGLTEHRVSPPAIAPRPASSLPPSPASPDRVTAQGGEPRRRLHLSLGSGSNGGLHPERPLPASQPDSPDRGDQAPQSSGTNPATHPHFNEPGWHAQPRSNGGTSGFPEAPMAPYHTEARQSVDDHAGRKDGAGAFVDRDLRVRVENDIAAFLTAFDQVLAEDTQASRAALREATDRLLRAGARTRIELERLEARAPLPRRDGTGNDQSVWRPR